MRNVTSYDDIKQVRDLFYQYVAEGKIEYINFKGLKFPDDLEKCQKKLENYQLQMLRWFKSFDRILDIIYEYPDVDLNTATLDDYYSKVRLVQNKERMISGLPNWLYGQLGCLTRRDMQPYQFVLLSLCGFEFKRETPLQIMAQSDMVSLVSESDILSEYMVVDDEISFSIPKPREKTDDTVKGLVLKKFRVFRAK